MVRASLIVLASLVCHSPTCEGDAQASLSTCQKDRLAKAAEPFPKRFKMDKIFDLVCHHAAQPAARVEAALRMQQMSKNLDKASEAIRKRLEADFPLKKETQFNLESVNKKEEMWLNFVDWVNDLALQSDKHEVRLLAGQIQEALFLQARTIREKLFQGTGGRGPWPNLHSLLQSVWGVIDSYSRAGAFDRAEAAFNESLNVEWPSAGRFPIRYFYDTKDFRLVSQGPEPFLRVLPNPMLLTSDERLSSMKDFPELLPSSLVDSLRKEWPTLAREASSISRLFGRDDEGGDAYPTIAIGKQWTKLTVYDVTDGWRNDLCSSKLKTLCTLLRGSLRTEGSSGKQLKASRLVAGNDETVTLFSVRAGGWAGLHNGQDRRVNVHLCLSGCNSSRIIVAGKTSPYHDGSLFAFEDRAQHEVINEAPPGSADRINLVIGVLHPDFDLSRTPKRRGQGMRLDWWFDQIDSGLFPDPKQADPGVMQEISFEMLHADYAQGLKHLQSKGFKVKALMNGKLLHEAASLGSLKVAKALIGMRADVQKAAPMQPMHLAANSGHLPMVELLLSGGAMPSPPISPGQGLPSPFDLAKRSGHTSVMDALKKAESKGFAMDALAKANGKDSSEGMLKQTEDKLQDQISKLTEMQKSLKKEL